jgi:hypothetical protein
MKTTAKKVLGQNVNRRPASDRVMLKLGLLGQFWDRCCDFKNIFAETMGEKWAFLLKLLLCSFCKYFIITLVLEKNANFFR